MYHARNALGIAVVALLAGLQASAQTTSQPLKVIVAEVTAGHATSAFDGVVEAVRQTVVAAQVAGAVVQLDAKAGDRVTAGQVLLRIDARAAEQNAAASDAQVQAAKASLDLAAKDFERQQRLFQQSYISQAALEHAESVYKSAHAQANALLAQASVSRTQSGFHIVRAPFAGVVSEVSVSLGDMAMPSRPLVTLYDPTALRVAAAVPQSVAVRMPADPKLRIELPGLPAAHAWVVPEKVLVLPTADAGSHTIELRAELPRAAGTTVSPGMFARVWLPLARSGAPLATPAALVTVPVEAVVRRAELTGLYVLNSQGKPVLRQVRLGRASGGLVEVLSGLMPGEQVASDPQSAARVR